MPLAKSQVLILSDLHHSREPVIERSQCHKLDASPTTIAISSVSNLESTLKTKISQTKTTKLSPADHQSKLEITNPWGPMFKDYEAFIDAHIC